MDSSQRVLNSYSKLFLNFELVFEILTENRRNIKTNSTSGVNNLYTTEIDNSVNKQTQTDVKYLLLIY